MIPPLSTRQLQSAIEQKRREEAAQRWTRMMAAAARPPAPSTRTAARLRRP